VPLSLVLLPMALQEFLDPDTAASLGGQRCYDYVVDCIDSVAPKCALLLAAHAAGVQVGAAGRHADHTGWDHPACDRARWDLTGPALAPATRPQVVSSMGAGGRLDPARVRIADIAATYNDSLAAVVSSCWPQ